MLYRCDCCGNTFDEEEVRVVSDNVGEFWGAPAYMDREVCPYCGSEDFEETPEEDEEDLEDSEDEEV